MGSDKFADFRGNFGPKAGSIEYAVMADAGLKMPPAQSLRKIGA
jgi:hypothetical protein